MKRIVAIAITPLALALSGCGGGASAVITHKVESVVPLNSSTVRIYVRWTNVGKASGSASCSINATATDANGDQVGSGVDSAGTNGNLAPGASQTLYQDMTITGNAAQLVNSPSDISIVDC